MTSISRLSSAVPESKAGVYRRIYNGASTIRRLCAEYGFVLALLLAVYWTALGMIGRTFRPLVTSEWALILGLLVWSLIGYGLLATMGPLFAGKARTWLIVMSPISRRRVFGVGALGVVGGSSLIAGFTVWAIYSGPMGVRSALPVSICYCLLTVVVSALSVVAQCVLPAVQSHRLSVFALWSGLVLTFLGTAALQLVGVAGPGVSRVNFVWLGGLALAAFATSAAACLGLSRLRASEALTSSELSSGIVTAAIFLDFGLVAGLLEDKHVSRHSSPAGRIRGSSWAALASAAFLVAIRRRLWLKWWILGYALVVIVDIVAAEHRVGLAIITILSTYLAALPFATVYQSLRLSRPLRMMLGASDRSMYISSYLPVLAAAVLWGLLVTFVSGPTVAAIGVVAAVICIARQTPENQVVVGDVSLTSPLGTISMGPIMSALRGRVWLLIGWGIAAGVA